VARVVGVSSEDGGGAVDLLGQYNASELVGQGEASEGEEQVGADAGGRRPSVCRADTEHEALGAVVAKAADSGGEVLGGKLLAGAVEQDGMGADASRLLVEPGKKCRLGLEGLRCAGEVAVGASNVIGEEAVGGLGLGASGFREDRGEGDLHRCDLDRVSIIRGL
jgi:hypothetical protein